MQRGTILIQRNKWCLRFYEDVIRDGLVIRKKSFRILAPVNRIASGYADSLRRNTTRLPLALAFVEIARSHPPVLVIL